MKPPCKTPCAECPFTKTSARGWLGPWSSAEAIHRQVMNEGELACHMTVKHDGVEDKNVRRCAGSILYMNKGFKKARDKEIAGFQNDLKEVDKSNILSVPEFLKHHNYP